MKGWKKIALIAGGVVVLLAIVGFTVQQSRKGVVAVQTGKVVREDLTSVVTASGEIKPKVYVNIGAILQAKITHLYVKEGDRVKAGQLLASLDNIHTPPTLPPTMPW
jgi:HlyD family secretion protein